MKKWPGNPRNPEQRFRIVEIKGASKRGRNIVPLGKRNSTAGKSKRISPPNIRLLDKIDAMLAARLPEDSDCKKAILSLRNVARPESEIIAGALSLLAKGTMQLAVHEKKKEIKKEYLERIIDLHETAAFLYEKAGLKEKAAFVKSLVSILRRQKGK